MDKLQEEDESHSERDIEEQKIDMPDTDEESHADDAEEDMEASQVELHAPIQHSKSLEELQNQDDTSVTQLLDQFASSLKTLASNASSEESLRIAEKLSLDYEQLKSAVFEGRQQVKTLAKRATEMSTELSVNAQKVQAVLKTSQSEAAKLATAKKELKKAWKTVEAGKEKEIKTKEIISSLKNEIIAIKSGVLDPNMSSSLIASGAANLGKNRLLSMQLEQDEQLKNLTKVKLLTQYFRIRLN
jgi:hypothetical protein